MTALSIVGLFEGYGGLTMGVQSVLGGELVAYAEIEPAMVSLLAQHHPGIPNLGDVSKVDWSQWAGHVDVMTGGFPCQDVSLAGLRRGLRVGTRSGLWSEFARGIDTVRPGLVVIENVRGLLSAEADRNMEPGPWDMGRPERGHRPALRALGAVLGDLADLGYDARWCGVRAADAGAPHGRYRVFIVAHPAGQPWSVGHGDDVRPRGGADGRAPHAGAGGDAANAAGRGRHGRAQEPVGSALERAAAPWRGGAADVAQDADGSARGERGLAAPGEATSGRARPDASRRAGTPTADADDRGRGPVERDLLAGEPNAARRAAADADGALAGRGDADDVARSARAGESDGDQWQRHGDAAGDRSAATREWGPYAPAIEQWEARLGRVAPAPTNPDGKGGAHRLAPQFVEWMMGLPQGHVTEPALGLTRAQQLKALGNGVVLQQAALAVQALLQMEPVEELIAA